jgi:hypothetical protein
VAANDQDRDEFEKRSGASQSELSTAASGEVTKALQRVERKLAEPPFTIKDFGAKPETSHPGGPASAPAPSPGSFTQRFGGVDTSSPRPGLGNTPDESSKPVGGLEVEQPASVSPPGAFTKLFSTPQPQSDPGIEGWNEPPKASLPSASSPPFQDQDLNPAGSKQLPDRGLVRKSSSQSREPQPATPSEVFQNPLAPESQPRQPLPAIHLPGDASLRRATAGERKLKPGSFTRLFRAVTSPPSPSQKPANPKNDLTRMRESGSAPQPQTVVNPFPEVSPYSSGTSPLSPTNPQQATKLFSQEKQADVSPNIESGPSSFTRVINSSNLRSAQENSGAAAQPTANPLVPVVSPNPPASTPITSWTPPSAPVVGYPQTPAIPTSVPGIPSAWSAPPVALPYPPQIQPPQVSFPSSPPVPAPAAEPTPNSKLTAYLPLIIAMNFLLLLAILVIVLFAVKK